MADRMAKVKSEGNVQAFYHPTLKINCLILKKACRNCFRQAFYCFMASEFHGITDCGNRQPAIKPYSHEAMYQLFRPLKWPNVVQYIFGGDFITAEDDEALDDVAKLPDIARPV